MSPPRANLPRANPPRLNLGGPLTGLRLAVTRPTESAATLVARLEADGAQVLATPAIERRSAPVGPLRAAARGVAKGRFAAIAFTSAAAVEPFVQALFAIGLDARALHGRLVGVVGAATGAALRARGIAPDLGEEAGDATALGAALAAELSAGAEVLAPRAREAREELGAALAAAGVQLCGVEAYRTVAVPRSRLRPLVRAAASLDGVIVASPSAVEALLAAGLPAATTQWLAIGHTTAAALAAHGARKVRVADAPTPDGIAAAARALVSAGRTSGAAGARAAKRRADA